MRTFLFSLVIELLIAMSAIRQGEDEGKVDMKRFAALLFASLLVFGALFVVTGCSGGSSVKVENGVIVEDGTYTADVLLEGGTGKATVQSPATITVSGGEMTANIIWSSSNYDLMIVNDKEYTPITIEGGSTFEIPISALDEALPVQAETTAMSQPHMIEYHLTFHSKSLKPAK